MRVRLITCVLQMAVALLPIAGTARPAELHSTSCHWGSSATACPEATAPALGCLSEAPARMARGPIASGVERRHSRRQARRDARRERRGACGC
jgi:hypothetical protein